MRATPNRRPPSWSSVWLEARRRGRDPVAALVDAGLFDAAEVKASSPLESARPSRQRVLPGFSDRDRAEMVRLEAELGAPVAPRLTVAETRSPRPRRRRASSSRA